MKKFLSFLLIFSIMLTLISISDTDSLIIKALATDTITAKLDTLLDQYPSGKYWNGGNIESVTSTPCSSHSSCNNFQGNIQCNGFAKMIIYKIFGKSSGSYRTWNYACSSLTGMKLIGSTTDFSSSSVKSLLSNARPGDILQFASSKQHTMIVYSVGSSNVKIYHCNWDNECGIELKNFSFGAWSGRNSTKLSLIRATNYDDVADTTYSYTIKYNANGGTGTMASSSVKYGNTFTLAANAFTKTGNTFSGWNVYRSSDKKWYVKGEGWFTASEISSNGYTKSLYANKMQTTLSDSWVKGGAINDTLTFYAVWTPNILNVSFNANGSTISSDTYSLKSSVVYNSEEGSKFIQKWVYNNKKTNGLVNYTTLGLSKVGNTFSGWGTSSSGGTVFSQSDTELLPTDINSAIKTGNCSSTLYAIWAPNKLNVTFNANGGIINSDTYTLMKDDFIYYTADKTLTVQPWTYNIAKTNGLPNISTLGLSKPGYIFKGWGTTTEGGTIFDQNNTDLLPIDINPSIETDDCETILYAIWEKDTRVLSLDTEKILAAYDDILLFEMDDKSATYQWYACNNYDKSDKVLLRSATSSSCTPMELLSTKSQQSKYRYFYCEATYILNDARTTVESSLCTNGFSSVKETGLSVIDYDAQIIYTDSINNINDYSKIIEYNEIDKVIVSVKPSLSHGSTLCYGTGTKVIISNDDGKTTAFTIVVYGDVDGDGVIDVLDGSQICSISNGLQTIDGIYSNAADINGDGVISTLDYQATVNKMLS